MYVQAAITLLNISKDLKKGTFFVCEWKGFHSGHMTDTQLLHSMNALLKVRRLHCAYVYNLSTATDRTASLMLKAS
jgi:hypothetical protein